MVFSGWKRGVRVRWLAFVGKCVGLLGAAWLVTACQTPPAQVDVAVPLTFEASDAEAAASYQAGMDRVFPGWELRRLPGKHWAPFTPVEVDGQLGLQVRASSSLSLLRKRVAPPLTVPVEVSFSWWAESVIDGADLSDSGASDAPVQLLLAFDGDRSMLSARNAMMSELLLLVTGEELPYASLVYVWATDHPVGSIIRDPRSDRIRYLVVEQGNLNLRRWVHHRRDVHADFRLVFGEEPGPLAGLAIMTDTDNTRTQTRGVFGPVKVAVSTLTR